MYDLTSFGTMLADPLRIDAYVAAIKRTVRPGDVVIDLGAGTGLMAMLACRCGASRVYAIELAEAICLGPELARVNGYEDRIVFIRDFSTNVTLPEQADVILSDLRGSTPLYSHIIPSLADARTRLLKPGGLLIPQQDTLWAGLADAPNLYAEFSLGWEDERFDFNMEPVRRVISETGWKLRCKPEQLLSSPQIWAVLDYATRTDPNVHGSLNWTLERDGTAHGFNVWFDALLVDDIGFSTSPAQPKNVYGGNFCRFTQPIPVKAGDVISIDLRADLIGEDYVWSWVTQACRQGNPTDLLASYRQSSLQILSLEQIRRTATRFKPQLDTKGEIDRAILNWMDGETSLEEIACRTMERFPERFTSQRAALTHIGKISQQYSR